MSYSRGLHLINPELDKVSIMQSSSEFRTGRRHFTYNKNQSSGISYQFEDREPKQMIETRPLSEKPVYQPSQYAIDSSPAYPTRKDLGPPAADPWAEEEAARLKEAIRQREEELRLIQEQSAYTPPPAYRRTSSQAPQDSEPIQLSRNSNLMEFERVKRDDVSPRQLRKRTNDALMYQRSEKLRLKELERQVRDTEAIERLENIRKLQEDELRKKAELRIKAEEYRRQLDIQAQAKALLKSKNRQFTSPPGKTIPIEYDLSENQPPWMKANYIPEAAYPGQVPKPVDEVGSLSGQKSFVQNLTAFYGEEEKPDYSQGTLTSVNGAGQPVYSRRQGRNYRDTSQLIG